LKESSNVSLLEQKAPDYFFDRKLKKIKEIFLTSTSSVEVKKKFAHYWNRFYLHTKEERSLASLSGGEGQALKICLSLCVPKEIYILDEPSQYLDNGAKEKLRLLLEELIQEGKTLLVIEHDTTWLPKPMKIMKLVNHSDILVLGETWTI
jgi:energy-coupling factor transporter ATP-binding protein EcfA2